MFQVICFCLFQWLVLSDTPLYLLTTPQAPIHSFPDVPFFLALITLPTTSSYLNYSTLSMIFYFFTIIIIFLLPVVWTLTVASPMPVVSTSK
jgi:hypothetical protein